MGAIQRHRIFIQKDGDGCCGAAGMTCECNITNPPWNHKDLRDDQRANDGEQALLVSEEKSKLDLAKGH